MDEMTSTVVFRRSFEAAHRLPKVPEEHKCFSIHGHSYSCEIRARITTSISLARAEVNAVIRDLDHRYLNECDRLQNPTSENLAREIWFRLQDSINLESVLVAENNDSWCRYLGSAPAPLRNSSPA